MLLNEESRFSKLMPYSTSKFKEEIKDHLTTRFPSENTTILDIGAGAGAYSDLLRDHYPLIDSIEIWYPYIQEFKLESKYRKVFNVDALDFFRGNDDFAYDIAILGDVLEHFEIDDAIDLIRNCVRCCKYVIVIVPFKCNQDEVSGNKYERHLQPDLDFQTMNSRFGTFLELLMHGFHSSDKMYEIAVYHSRTVGYSRCNP